MTTNNIQTQLSEVGEAFDKIIGVPAAIPNMNQ
jgi:hypothetical protein